MAGVKDIKMKPKLIGAFVLAGLLPLCIVAYSSMYKADGALMKEASNKLDAVRVNRKIQVESWFQTIDNQIKTFSEDAMVVDAMRQFKRSFKEVAQENKVSPSELEKMRSQVRKYYTVDFSEQYRKQNDGKSPPVEQILSQLYDESIVLQYYYIAANPNPLGSKNLLDASPDNSSYSRYHSTVHPILRSYLEKFGYYDIFLVDAETGDIVYTQFKELDYTTSLINGPYAGTGIGECFRKAVASSDKDVSVLTDFAVYTPSYDAPAGFIASPIFDGNKKIGVAIFQIPIDRLNTIMTERTGMGETGETYLVGADKKMRSDSYLDPENHSIAASFSGTVEKNGVDTEASRNALAGKSGVQIITDYNGNPVLSAYSPVVLPSGITWAILAEIDKAEIRKPVKALLYEILLIGVILSILVVIFAVWMAAGIARPVARVTEVANEIAVGDLNKKVDIYQKDEIGQLAEAFRNMSKALQDKSDTAGRIANGDLSAEVKVLSERDTLGNSMVLMLKSLKAMNTEVDGLIKAALEGKLDTRADAVRHNGDYGKMVEGLNQLLEATVSPIKEVAGVLEAAAGKDLTKRVEGNYHGQLAEFKDNTNLMIVSLHDALSQVNSAVEQVASASNQISIGSQSLAEGASEQASSLEELSSSMEEMSSMTKQSADNANQAKTLSMSARDSASSGLESMKKMSEAIDKIKRSSDQTAKIVKTIDEIAFQTNLLALNAAVEAARAGEAGKGFAVVAEEVRNLAQRSAQAAKNTAEMIEESVKNAEGGVNITKEVAEALGEISDGSVKVNDLVAEIVAALQEQAQGIDQINSALSQLNIVTQQNASSSEESASTSEELNSQAEELASMISEFKLNENDVIKKKASVAAPRAAEFHSTPAILTKRGPTKKVVEKNRVKTNGSSGKGDEVRRVAPEKVIPLDDECFKDF